MYEKKVMSHKKAGLEPAPTAQNLQSPFPPKKRITAYGFSMIEVMITMVIVSTCLVLTLRVFSTCARAVSGASMELRCMDILKEKLNSVYVKSIEEDGIDIYKRSESIEIDEINFDFGLESIVMEIEDGKTDEMNPEEELEEDYGKKTTNLMEVNCDVFWGEEKFGKFRKIKAIFPGKGKRSEYV